MSAGDDDLACVGLSCGGESFSGLSWRVPNNALVLITEIRLLNNSLNASGLATGNGFGSVTISVTGEDPFTPLFRQEVDLNGAGDDPDVIVQPNVVGRAVSISFRGHDSPTSGGISELEIIAVPA